MEQSNIYGILINSIANASPLETLTGHHASKKKKKNNKMNKIKIWNFIWASTSLTHRDINKI